MNFLSFLSQSFEHMFITDKHGKLGFFPWGIKKQGYFLTDKKSAKKIKSFYGNSLLICLVFIFFTGSTFYNFWAIVGSTLFYLSVWYFVYYIYTINFTKSLPITRKSYKEIVLEKLEVEDVESQEASIIPSIKSQKGQAPEIKKDNFIEIKRVLSKLSPDQLFLTFFFIGFLTLILYIENSPNKVGAQPEDFLVLFFVLILWGISGFIIVKNMDGFETNLIAFINWKLPMILMTVICWGFAVFVLYKFIVMTIN